MGNKKKSIIIGAIIIAVLVVIMLLLNVLLGAFGETLAAYVGGGTVSADAGGDSMTEAECIAEGREIADDILAEGSVLLRNENNALPLAKGSKITILGAQSFNYVAGGTGSAGGAYDKFTYTMKEAFDGSKSDDGTTSTSKVKYLDVNAKAWTWLQTAVGGLRNVDTTGDYVGTEGNGTVSNIKGSNYPNQNGAATLGNKDNYGNGDWGGYKRVCEFTKDVYGKYYDSDIKSDGYNDTVIVNFARSGAEGASPVMDYDGDGKPSTGATYLQLSVDEKDLLEFCNAKYSKTIVLINSSAAVELGEIEQTKYGVDACLWIGHPGEAGLVGVAQVLTGEANASGKLVDTFAYDMSTMPSFYNNDDNKYANLSDSKTAYGDNHISGYYQYEEGIYVGYRYYETADAAGYFTSSEFTSREWKNGKVSGYDKVVQYPFGYGLSYTTFDQEITATNIRLNAHGTGSVTVKVSNTGTVAGKELVQIYMEAPYNTDENCGISGTGLQKSAKVLVGFEKTKELAPKGQSGDSQEVTITFDTDDLSSFDTYGYGCYVLEKGDYCFHAGKNAHNDYDKTDKVTLSNTIIYNEDNAGARDSDENVAKVAMADVDAGDGNMLEGYLNRSAFATGMASIMTHESSCKTENLKETAKAALATAALSTTDYKFTTYEGGKKVEKTVKKYVNGTSILAYSEEANWEGLKNDADRYLYDDVYENHEIEYGKVYYVVVDENGQPELKDGKYQVTETETSMRLDVDAEILKDADYDDEIWAYLLDQTTLAEQITVQGGLGWNTPALASVNKTRVTVVDGPGEAGNGNASYTGNTWIPSAVVNAATWNPYLIERLGHVYAHQAIKSGIGGAYAPAMNTHRSPFGGRNFEYYSEDGFIAGYIGAAMISGLQAEGVVVFIKHMAMNDSDTNRDGNITWFSEQSAREIYLRCYEISVHTIFVSNSETKSGYFAKGEGALGIMSSLNRDGLSMFHQGLYKNILRGEWGFNGLIITDGVGPQGNVMSPVAGLYGGVEGQLGGSPVTSSNFANVEGNASKNNYGRYLLRQTTKHMLYQACHSAQIEASINNAWKVWWTVGNIVLGVAMAAVAVIFIVLPVVKKKQ